VTTSKLNGTKCDSVCSKQHRDRGQSGPGSSAATRTTISDAAVARSAQTGTVHGDRVDFFRDFGNFLGKTQLISCRKRLLL
jgi:hypothetical protein